MTRGRHGGRELRDINQQIMSGRYDNPSNRGVRKRFETMPVVGGFQLQQTQLITVRLDKGPRQLLVTMMTPSKGASGTTPWQSSWNNTDTPPPGSVWTAPLLPDPAKGLRCELRWGAGGAAGVTQFDYPALGATFGVTADTVDLNVLKPVDSIGTPLVYTEETVPYVGAFLCEGQAADPTPLRWLEAFAPVPNTTGVRYYVVKPYARRVHVTIDASNIAVDFLDASNGVLWRSRYVEPVATAGIDTVIEVPAQATTMIVGNTGGVDADYLCVEWNIGLV